MQPSVNPLPLPKLQFFDANGHPLAGGKVYTYLSGTSVPASTYTSAAKTAFNPNPVILDARGEASIWIGPLDAYRVVLKTSTDVLVYSADGITLSNVSTFKSLQLSGTGSTTAFSVSVGTTPPLGIYIYINGIYQQKDAYTLINNILTFNEAPPAGTNNIELIYVTAFTFGDLDSATIANINIVGGNIDKIYEVVDHIDVIITNADNIATVAQNIANVNFVGSNIGAVQLIEDNIIVIQQSPVNAAYAADAAAYLSSYIDQILMNVTFPLDLGLIIDPVAPFNAFDLGAL